MQQMSDEILVPFERSILDTASFLTVQEALAETQGGPGIYIENLETEIAAFCECPYAVAFTSESLAFQGAFFAASIGRFDRVITSPNNYPYLAMAALINQCQLSFVDIDQASGNLDYHLLMEMLSNRYTRGKTIIAPSHFSGMPLDVPRISKAIDDPNVLIIEDATDALCGHYSGRQQKIGSCAYSDMTVVSLRFPRPAHMGEGAIVLTHSKEYCDKLRAFRDGDGHDIAGPVLRSYPTSFQGALGLSQVSRLASRSKMVRQRLRMWRDELVDIPYLSMMPENYDAYAAPQHFVVQIDYEAFGMTRSALQERLKERGVETRVLHDPLYRQLFYKNLFGERQEQFPRMEAFYAYALSLPLYPELREEDIKLVAGSFKSLLAVRE